jgi:hypothetical protein
LLICLMHMCCPQGVEVSEVLGASQAAVAAAEEAQARRDAVAARAAAARNKKTIAQQILAVSSLPQPLRVGSLEPGWADGGVSQLSSVVSLNGSKP